MSLTTRLSPQQCAERLASVISADGVSAGFASLSQSPARQWIGMTNDTAFRISKARYPLADTTYVPVMCGEITPAEDGGALLGWRFTLYPGSRYLLSAFWIILGFGIGVGLVGQPTLMLLGKWRPAALGAVIGPLALGAAVAAPKVLLRRKYELERESIVEFLRQLLQAEPGADS